MDQTSETEKTYQRTKYNEIIEILLSAGYFRARIHTLSEFDKVVGGLCWCITSSGESVDVDILFQENSTIGQKISLSEAIVVALRKMGCPAPIQPHQIQGGVGGADYPAIYQVIVWLVKKYFERRVEREQQLRSYSIFQFSKNYHIPDENDHTVVSSTLKKIISRNKAVRLYKRRANKNETEETRVRSCLLEFGESFAKLGGAVSTHGMTPASAGFAGSTGAAGAAGSASSVQSAATGESASSTGGLSIAEMAAKAVQQRAVSAAQKSAAQQAAAAAAAGGDGITSTVPVVDAIDVALADLSKLDVNELSGFEKQLARAAKEAKRDELLFAEKAHREESEIMKQMSEIDESTAAAVSGAQVGNIVGLGADEISNASAAYRAELEESKKQLDQNVASGRLGAAAVFTRQMQNLLKVKDELTVKERDVKEKVVAWKEKFKNLQEDKVGLEDYITQLHAQKNKLMELEQNSTQKAELTTVKNLIVLNESLKSKEAEFKAACKAKRQEYLDKLGQLDAEEREDASDMQQQKEIESMHSKVLAKYNRLRQMLAEANLEVASSVRVIDDTPTRTELVQYERRFVELYQQSAWKLEETRKYYDVYNTLETTLGFLQKEIKLLNSISENFNEAMKSAQSKGEYSKQFENIVRGVEESLKRQESSLQVKLQKVEELKQIHQSLVDEQRRYYKAVKDFQDECNKNEWLQSKLQEISK